MNEIKYFDIAGALWMKCPHCKTVLYRPEVKRIKKCSLCNKAISQEEIAKQEKVKKGKLKLFSFLLDKIA